MTHIKLIYTGGTIGMTRESSDDPLRPAGKEELLKHLPDLSSMGINIDFHSFEPLLDSSDMSPDNWLQMARAIQVDHEKYDGFVILHGTDTMAYTSSGLSFMLENLSVPVILTGSQLPISDPRTDGVENLVNSIMIAAYKASKLPRVPEVLLVFGSRILRGCRATKVSSKQWEGFDSPNCPHIGDIGEHIEIYRHLIRDRDDVGAPLIVNDDICREIDIVECYPGFTSERLREKINVNSVKGVVFKTFGAGNAPTSSSFLGVIAQMHATGKTFVNVSQCLDGMVEMGLYEASSGLVDHMISGLDMTTEAAYAKLVINHNRFGDDINARRRELMTCLRGEQSLFINELRYTGIGDDGANDRRSLPPQSLPGLYAKGAMERASIRLTNVGIKGISPNEVTEISVFLNLRTATIETPKDDPHHAVTFRIRGSSVKVLIKEVTNSVLAVVKPGGNVEITIVSSKGRIWFEECTLSIFQRAEYFAKRERDN